MSCSTADVFFFTNKIFDRGSLTLCLDRVGKRDLVKDIFCWAEAWLPQTIRPNRLLKEYSVIQTASFYAINQKILTKVKKKKKKKKGYFQNFSWM